MPIPRQEILYHQLNITGQPDIFMIQDYWGNRAGMFNLIASHRELVIESKLIVRTLGKSTISQTNEASLVSLKNEIANNLSLLELSFITEIELREKINEMVQGVL